MPFSTETKNKRTDYLLKIKRRAEYGNRTRLPGLGSPCTTDVLIPQKQRCINCIKRLAFALSRYSDSNRGPTHYECVALPTEPYRQCVAKVRIFLNKPKILPSFCKDKKTKTWSPYKDSMHVSILKLVNCY